MWIIPAIDIKDGRCVRLRQGRMDDETVFSEDPVAVALRWAEAGADRLHLVDLDGAVAGGSRHAALIERIVRAVPDMKVQVGGGIRDARAAKSCFDAGVDTVVIGTLAVRDSAAARELCRRHPHRIAIAVDVRDGLVQTAGWLEGSELRAGDLAERFADWEPASYIYTDINRDGLLGGLDLKNIEEFAASTATPVIASGGVSSHEDIEALEAGGRARVAGVIIGRALYEGRIDLARLLARPAQGGFRANP